jgi:hypothetical protein
MARLPGYENQRTVGTGSEFMRARPVRDQTAASLQSLGSSLASVGSQLANVDARLEEKARRDQERVDRLEAERDLISNDGEASRMLIEARDNMPESGRGFYDGFMPKYDNMWQEKLKTVPDRLKPEMETQYFRQREQMATRVAGMESEARRAFTVKVSREKGESLYKSIVDGAMPHDMASAEADKYVASLALPPNASKQLRREIGMRVDAAAVERGIRTDPEGTLRALKSYVPGTPRSANPNVQLSIEAAERNGVPVDIILPIIEGESKFDHTTDMSKKINPATGRPYSSAYGLGQMIDANWKEVGLQKSSDPAIQAEATARLLRKRIDFLQSNQIDVTPQNVWGAHFVGPAGFNALVRAAERNPNAPLRDVLLPLYGEANYRSATTGNGAILRDGSTVGQTLANIRGYVDRNIPAAQARLAQGMDRDPASIVEVGGAKLSYMTGQDAAKYIGAATEVIQQRRDADMKAWQKQQIDDGILNPFTATDRKTMDKHAATTGVHTLMNAGDPDAYGQAKAFLAQHKYLPKPFAEEAELAVLSPDSKKRAMAYDLLSTVEVEQPMGGLRQSGIQPDIVKRVERYVALRTQFGFSNDRAVAAVEREFSPEFGEKVKRDKDRVDNIVKRQTLSELETAMGSSNGFFSGAQYGTEANKRAMLAAYQDRVRYHLNDGAGDDTALALARQDMSRAYGVDTSFGERRTMHWPPSRVLPTGADGTHKWVAESVTSFVNDALAANGLKRTVKPNQVFLIGTSETQRSLMAGQSPLYEVAFKDEKGRVQMLPGGFRVSAEEYHRKRIEAQSAPPPAVSRADVSAAREQQKREDTLGNIPTLPMTPGGAAVFSGGQ